ncbi:MAG: hypothetical protein JRI32_04930 [Deltaproteobacteria bacterium]|nr:hypothetical protein [Deltaproteobacteria bacterium]
MIHTSQKFSKRWATSTSLGSSIVVGMEHGISAFLSIRCFVCVFIVGWAKRSVPIMAKVLGFDDF